MTGRRNLSGLDTDGLLLIDDRQDLRRANYLALRHWYAALARREFEPATVVFLGDSMTRGDGASTMNKSFTRLYTDAIQRMYRPGGIGWISTGPRGNPPTSEWTFVGGSLLSDTGVGYYSRMMTGQAQTASITITGDRFWLLFQGNSFQGGNAEIIIDGGSPISFNTFSATNVTFKYDSGVLPETVAGNVHTVQVRGAVGISILLDGIYVFNTDYGKGVQVWEIGHSAVEASYFAASSSTTTHWLAFKPDIIDPDLMFIQFGLNEQVNGTSAATFKTNLQSIIDNARAATKPDCSIVLLGLWAPSHNTLANQTEAQWLPFRTVMRELQVEQDIGFFDLYDLAGWTGTTGDVYVRDLVTTNGSAVVTSNSAYFRAVDVGRTITGTGIPGSTTILSYQSKTQVTLSANATATSGASGIVATILAREDPDVLTEDFLHPSDIGHQWIADELTRLTAGLPRLANIPLGLFDAAGDIAVATAADAAARLPAGTEGQALHVETGTPKKLVWADPGMMGRLIQSIANPGATTFFSDGHVNPTVTDPGTGPTNADQPDGPYVQILTLVTSGSDASVATPFNICRSAWIPEMATVIRTPAAITNIRLVAGLYSATPQDASDPAIHAAGFRYDTAVDGTAFWRTYTNDGTSTGTVTTTTAAIAASTKYRLRIEFWGTVGTNATEIRFYINGALVSIHTTNLPGGSTNNLGYLVGISTLTTAITSVLISRISLSHV